MAKKLFSAAMILVIGCFSLLGCSKNVDWKEAFDTSLPDLNDGKWTQTMNTDFTKITTMEELYEAKWAPSPHGKRNYEYWCDQMIDFTENGLVVRSRQETDHSCDVCGVSEGVFTSGIETRGMVDGKRQSIFDQAFGYFEATVIVPRGTGMWSAFWLQSDNTGKVGHQGKDGSEIDVYESSFMRANPTKTGQAIHYDAYDAPFYRSNGNVTDVQKNLYDGMPHTYALKWTPTEYVMYVDGEAVWASNDGGVSKTPEYLRLTVEIRDTQYGSYGQEIGTFQNHDDGTNDFVIQNVKVYQNTDYIESIKAIDDYKDMEKTYMGLIIGSAVVGGGLVIAALGVGIKYICKKAGKRGDVK